MLNKTIKPGTLVRCGDHPEFWYEQRYYYVAYIKNEGHIVKDGDDVLLSYKYVKVVPRLLTEGDFVSENGLTTDRSLICVLHGMYKGYYVVEDINKNLLIWKHAIHIEDEKEE
ncbi:MAG: hypothetical protein KAI17_09440 [Thiotrichaceae bacterium]|nr:hypothetical protein [Thiotrichaceae bacterium]